MSQEKKEIIIGIVGTILVLLVTGIYYYQYQNKISNLTKITNSIAQANTNQPANNNSDGTLSLSLQEVAKHNTTQDCWIIVENKVYNVSGYLNMHPGGAGTIIPYCGADASTAFLTKGGAGTHSSRASQDLSSLYLGDVGTQVQSSQLKTIQQNINTLGASVGGRGEYEDD
jgi:cytochrome b involved in lipid metabolism